MSSVRDGSKRGKIDGRVPSRELHLAGECGTALVELRGEWGAEEASPARPLAAKGGPYLSKKPEKIAVCF
jgi:hypothetical protein